MYMIKNIIDDLICEVNAYIMKNNIVISFKEKTDLFKRLTDYVTTNHVTQLTLSFDEDDVDESFIKFTVNMYFSVYIRPDKIIDYNL